MNLNCTNEFVRLLGPERTRTKEPMKKHTSFRIGGPADFFLLPSDEEQLSGILGICSRNDIPWFLLGNGSNLLVSDKGYRGAMICLADMDHIIIKDSMIFAQAGASLSRTAGAAREAALKGLAFAGGIPGTVGGAVVMNAGAYGGEICQVLRSVRLMTPEGRILEVPVGELELSYRSSRIMRTGEIVLEAVFALEKGDREEIRKEMSMLASKRAEKQPLEFPSAGSTFKRPAGNFAGRLIMECGLRGYQVGEARVSDKHCGFVVNTGQATAEDVCRLMGQVRKTVWEKTGVALEPEVRLLGEFEPWEELL